MTFSSAVSPYVTDQLAQLMGQSLLNSHDTLQLSTGVSMGQAFENQLKSAYNSCFGAFGAFERPSPGPSCRSPPVPTSSNCWQCEHCLVNALGS